MRFLLAAAGLALLPTGALADDEPANAGKSYAIPAAEIVGFDFLVNQFDRHELECCDFNSNIHTIRRNLRSTWVVDRDPFLVNQLGHPYQGSMYHGFARASGLGFWESLGYTFAGSAFWEIAGEATPPSRNDQVATGIGGSFFGEALFRMSNLVLEHGNIPPFWRELSAAVISPPVGFNRAAFGDRFRGIYPSHDPVYFTRLQLGFSGQAGNSSGISTAHLQKNEALADFLIDYGLPGRPGYHYERPFDYFSLQATLSSANGFENVMVRGLLKGHEYTAGERYRGVLGLYGTYDYIAPQTYQVSATGVALGTTGQYWASDKVAILGTFLLGSGYTAAGAIRSELPSYHYGLAPYSLAALRFIFGESVALDLTAREYYVSHVASAARGGHDNIARVDAALTFRVKGRHGVSIKYLGNRRDEYYPDAGDFSQRHATVGIFYTYLGHDLFGAEALSRR
ncbi:MAG TPA: DUF3943 domain-containing protein [Usitatibacter sp.]|nr:DUF3943 domain-containing protein [Usitatibacter sp.]